MSEDEELSCLIGQILDATLDPELWATVLAAICEFVNGQAGALLSKDAVSKAGTAHYHYGVDPHYMQIYAETYFRFDPTATLPFFDVGQIVCTRDLVPSDEFRQGRFYQEWVRPQGWLDAAQVVLEKSATSLRIWPSSAIRLPALSTMRCAGACGSSFLMSAVPS